MQPETKIAAAFKKAGFNTADHRLRLVLLDAAQKHKHNVAKMCSTVSAALDRDPDLRDEIIRQAVDRFLKTLPTVGSEQFVNEYWRSNPKEHEAGHGGSDTQSSIAASSSERGSGHLNRETQTGAATPVREPTLVQKDAAARSAQRHAATILDTFLIHDGRAIGDVRWGELTKLHADNHRWACVIARLMTHAQAPHDALVRDVVKAKDLQRFIKETESENVSA